MEKRLLVPSVAIILLSLSTERIVRVNISPTDGVEIGCVVNTTLMTSEARPCEPLVATTWSFSVKARAQRPS